MSGRAILLAILVALLLWLLMAVSLTHRNLDVSVRTVDDRELAWTPTKPATTTTTAAPTTTTATPRVVAHARSAPKPLAVPPARAEIVAAIRRGFARFGPAVAEQAVRVSYCETAETFDPHSTGAEGERGLFQIHPKWHQDRIARLGFTWDDMYDVEANIAVAVDIYSESRWGPWSCRTAA